MAPLPVNATHRCYFDYITGNAAGLSKEHTVMWRINGSNDDQASWESAQARMLVFLQAIGAANLRAGWRVIRCRFSAAATDFSLPVAIGAPLAAFAGTASGGAWAGDREALELGWEGRSYTTGRRGGFSLYGINVGVPADFRFAVGEAAFVAPSLTALSEIGGPPLVCADGTELTFYSYINAQYNSYWESRIRKG